MLTNHQECLATVTAVAPVGVLVDVDGHQGFIDQVKLPSWWSDASDVPPVTVGDQLHAVVLDAPRTPPRLSALESDARTAGGLRRAGR